MIRSYSSTLMMDRNSWWSCFRLPLRCRNDDVFGLLGSLVLFFISVSLSCSKSLEFLCSSSDLFRFEKALSTYCLSSATCSVHLLLDNDRSKFLLLFSLSLP